MTIRDNLTNREDLSKVQKLWLRKPESKIRAYENHKRFIENNPDKAKRYAFTARLKRCGMTEEQYYKALSEQNNLCAICKQPNAIGREWSIDHNHSTGQARGLLCHHCNVLIGHAFEDTNTLQSAIGYLKAYS